MMSEVTQRTDEGGDEAGAEPVVFLAFVEDEFERAEADGEKQEAEEVEVETLLLHGLHFLDDMRRVFDDAVGEEEADDGDGDIDEEDPAPVEVVGNPAAECGSDGGCADYGDAIHGEGFAAIFGLEGVSEDGLFAGG